MAPYMKGQGGYRYIPCVAGLPYLTVKQPSGLKVWQVWDTTAPGPGFAITKAVKTAKEALAQMDLIVTTITAEATAVVDLADLLGGGGGDGGGGDPSDG